MIGKNCCDPDVFSRIFRLLLKIFIMIMDSLKKAAKESVIILDNKRRNK